MRIGKRSLLSCVVSVCPLAFAAVALSAGAQTTVPNEWTWMGGSSSFPTYAEFEIGQPGIYGALGEAAPANVPGGRLGAVSWTDVTGDLWLFGGGGLDSNATFGSLNDLWRYDPSSNQWTWISGSSTIPVTNGGQPGSYGTLGKPAAGNSPGARTEAVGWTDQSGNLWLFGGAGFDSADMNGNLDDLWEFNVSLGEWAWMGGSNVLNSSGSVGGVYGAMGSFAAGNFPGSRNSATSWTDRSGNLWLFGGYGQDSMDQIGDLGDLWEYSQSLGQWAWMSGSDVADKLGVYGQSGEAAAGNMPGGREGSVAWTDKNGKLWLFGGYGFSTTSGAETNGRLNDLWEFDVAASEWTWIGGNSSFPAVCSAVCGWPGIYGTLGQFASTNIPSSRVSPIAGLDQSGNLWLFGGEGEGAAGTGVKFLNDLWEFDSSTDEWAWMGGNSAPTGQGQPGAYGTLGVAVPGNIPGGRESAVGWTDLYGNLWLFGGDGLNTNNTTVGYLNDLWEYAQTAATPTFSPVPGTYTSAQMVTISDATPGAVIYYTTNGTPPTISSPLYSGAVAVPVSETLQAIAMATGYSTSAVASAAYIIPPTFTVAASPASFTVGAGSSGTTTITVTPANGFNSSVAFACSGLPSGATCSFSPAAVTPSGSAAAATTLTVTTSAASAALHRASRPLFPGTALAVAICCIGWRKRRGLDMLFLLAVSAAGLGLLSACGGGGTSGGGMPPVQPVTSTVTVTAASGSLQQSTTFALTVN